MKSVSENIRLSKGLLHQFPWSTECLTLHPELPSRHVEGQQLQQHRIQSLQRQAPTAISKHKSVADTTHPRILARKIPQTEEPGGPQSMGWQRVRHHGATKYTHVHACTHTHTHARTRTHNPHITFDPAPHPNFTQTSLLAKNLTFFFSSLVFCLFVLFWAVLGLH